MPNGAGGEAPGGGAGTSASAGRGGQGGVSSAGAGGEPGSVSCAPNERRCAGETPEICDADRIWRPLLGCEAPTRCLAGECKEGLAHVCPLVPTLPRFTAQTQVVDGDGSEFSDIEPVRFDLRSAPVVSANHAAMLPTVVSARLAWTQDAFVAHVHVEDPAIYTYEGSTLEYHWQGDNVQFFIAPTDLLTGMYSGIEDGGATHLIIVPPSASLPSRAIEIYEPCYACVDATPSSVSYAARAVSDGYEVELAFPWTSPRGMFASGDRIALNLAVGAQDNAGAGLELEGLLANNPVDEDTPCGGATHPGCDDRTWCYSELE